ncbi:MAG: sulfurtransferase [Pseudomonadales bacterium]|nr:sulfurtransferase [Pseudomonadales bacterium]
MNTHPALINAIDLQQLQIDDATLLIIDLCSSENYNAGHIPGAVHIKPSQLSKGEKPAPGELPELATLQQLFQSIGLKADKHIIVYDDAGSSWAGRMIWTLTLIGHNKVQLLDGGRHAWQKAGLAFDTEISTPTTSDIQIQIDTSHIANMAEILTKLDNPNFKIWDARSPGEYDGRKILAQRGGHIPNAIHLEWTDLTDKEGFLLDNETLKNLLTAKGLTADKNIVTHCQTHRRSGLTWFVAKKLLAYNNIKAYPGSWSQWGNTPSTPIAMESFKSPN